MEIRKVSSIAYLRSWFDNMIDQMSLEEFEDNAELIAKMAVKESKEILIVEILLEYLQPVITKWRLSIINDINRCYDMPEDLAIKVMQYYCITKSRE